MRRPAASAAAAATDSQSAAEDSQATRMEMADVRAAFMDALRHAASADAISAELFKLVDPNTCLAPTKLQMASATEQVAKEMTV